MYTLNFPACVGAVCFLSEQNWIELKEIASVAYDEIIKKNSIWNYSVKLELIFAGKKKVTETYN